MLNRILHLVIGGALVAAYFLASPAHLWQPTPGMVPAPSGVVPASSWQHQPLDWPEIIIGGPVISRQRSGPDWLYWTGADDGAEAVYRVALPGREAASQPQALFTRDQLNEQLSLSLSALGQVLPLPGRWEEEQRLLLQSGDALLVLAVDLQGQLLRLVAQARTSPLARRGENLSDQRVALADGSVAVVLYGVDGNSYWLRLEPQSGQILSRQRLPLDSASAPVMLAGSAEQVALVMDHDQQWQLLASATAGGHWQRLDTTFPSKPGAPASGQVLADGSWLWSAPCLSQSEAGDWCFWHSRDYGAQWQSLAAASWCVMGDCSQAQTVSRLYARDRGPLQLFYYHSESGWGWLLQVQQGGQR